MNVVISSKRQSLIFNKITFYWFILFLTSQSMSGTIYNKSRPMNVLGGDLEICCTDPMTGFYRNGKCATGPKDFGVHVVCAIMTDSFLEYSKEQGNDLITARPEYNFPGLKSGDQWCLCVTRWKEAMLEGKAPYVKLEATHIAALEVVSIEDLKKFQLKKT